MSLKIYTKKESIPSHLKYVNYNDKFFASVELIDTPIHNNALRIIDKATYNSKDTFIGRDKSLGALNKSFLSTGCKTILNIASNPNICFDVIECGQNALNCLTMLTQGHILWTYPVLITDTNSECDIEINGKIFTHTIDLADYFEAIAKGEEDE